MVNSALIRHKLFSFDTYSGLSWRQRRMEDVLSKQLLVCGIKPITLSPCPVFQIEAAGSLALSSALAEGVNVCQLVDDFR